MKKIRSTFFAFGILMFCFCELHAQEVTSQLAMEAEKAGEHQKAIKLFSTLAEGGDTRAMIHVGNKYYKGNGVSVDYEKAMDWWLKALFANNGDAPGNVGVLFRDGKGVDPNRKIAYLLFLITHMEGLGSGSTQTRVNAHLRKEAAELSQEEIEEALCYTGEYLIAYVKARGKLESIPKEVLPSAGAIRFKDKRWWIGEEKERMKFTCEEPWS